VVADALTLIAFALLAVVVALATLRLAASDRAPTGTDYSLTAARELAERAHRRARLLLWLCAGMVVISLTVPVTLGTHVVLACWSAPLAVYAASLAERSQRALAGDRATASRTYLHVWRDDRLLAWFRVGRAQLAELGLPRARARR